MFLNRFSFWFMMFGCVFAKIAKKYRVYWFSLGPFCISSLILHKTLVIILWVGMSKSSFRCSGSQIEISIMKSVSEDQCEWLLIYNHDDLTYLDIEINSLKKIIFQLDLSWKLASKKRLKEILKEIGKENEFWKKFFIEFDFLI